jgi:CubicO group peptidase (beta-lactamase class C family)
MKRVLLTLTSILAAVVVWAGLLILAASQGWAKRALAPDGDWDAFAQVAVEIIDASTAGNAALALMHDGDVVKEYFASTGKPMNGDTLFQMASVSKWVTAWGVMKLVDQGRLDLDAPVDDYLNRWELPETDYDNRQVTVRRLLSHSAGLTDGLGYGGFESLEEIQSLEDSLTQAADSAGPDRGATRMGKPADGTWRYSGGGYSLLQLLIEEVSGRGFNEYMREEVLLPLGMSRSTFVVDRHTEQNLADYFDTDGSLATHYYYTALAAASLYTSTNDLLRFLNAHCEGPNGEPPGRGNLSAATLKSMRVPHAQWLGVSVWGLGTTLLAKNGADDYVIGHDGGNRPAINTTARIDPVSCDGIVLLTSGSEGIASQLGGDWVYWHTAQVGGLDFIRAVADSLVIFLIGVGVILIAGMLIGWKYPRKPK